MNSSEHVLQCDSNLARSSFGEKNYGHGSTKHYLLVCFSRWDLQEDGDGEEGFVYLGIPPVSVFGKNIGEENVSFIHRYSIVV